SGGPPSSEAARGGDATEPLPLTTTSGASSGEAHSQVGDVTSEWCQYIVVNKGDITINCDDTQDYHFVPDYDGAKVYAFANKTYQSRALPAHQMAGLKGSDYNWAWITADWNYICAVAYGSQAARVDCVQAR